MRETELKALNDRFAIRDHVQLVAGPGDLLTVEVNNAFAKGSMTLAGGHIMSYIPSNQPGLNDGRDVFWMSPNSAHVIGKPMRGGVPICWPWFGQHPEGAGSKPMHGFARIGVWTLASTSALPDGATEVVMSLADSPETRVIWPFAFRFQLKAIFGPALRIECSISNTGSKAFQYTGALHHYFAVEDVSKIYINGLDGTDYLDKVDNFAQKRQTGPVHIEELTDRIYINTLADSVIVDPVVGRKIRIAKEGSHATVVWNPAEKASQLPDIGLGAQVHFVCVETANAANDVINVPPGGVSSLVAQISVE